MFTMVDPRGFSVVWAHVLPVGISKARFRSENFDLHRSTKARLMVRSIKQLCGSRRLAKSPVCWAQGGTRCPPFATLLFVMSCFAPVLLAGAPQSPFSDKYDAHPTLQSTGP